MTQDILQPPRVSVRLRRAFGVLTLLVLAFVLPHLFGFSFLRWFELLPNDALTEIQNNPEGERAALILKGAAVYEVALLTLLLASLTILATALATAREVLARVLISSWPKGASGFMLFGLFLFAGASLFLVKGLLAANPAIVYKLGGVWGAALIPCFLSTFCLIASMIILLEPSKIRQIEEWREAHRYRHNLR